MEQAIMTSIITSACTLLGVIITVIVSSRKTKTEMELTQKQQQKEIEEIKKQLKEHNNYATRIPVIQTELEFIRETLNDIKHRS